MKCSNALIFFRASILVTLFLSVYQICFTSAARADDLLRDRQVLVPPVDEISIIDPGTNSTGKPEPLIDGSHVEIPPTVIVHKYYYSGDRDFRGPVFPGGPSIVVVQHPCTGEKLYLDVQMLPGSPRVVYRKHAIDYHFSRQLIRIQFFDPLHPLQVLEPTVKYCNGNEEIQKALSSDNSKGKVGDLVDRTGVPTALKSVAKGTHSLAQRGADGIRRGGEVATQPFKQLASSTAIGGFFSQSEEAAAASLRDQSVKEAQKRKESQDKFIPTLR